MRARMHVAVIPVLLLTSGPAGFHALEAVGAELKPHDPRSVVHRILHPDQVVEGEGRISPCPARTALAPEPSAGHRRELPAEEPPAPMSTGAARELTGKMQAVRRAAETRRVIAIVGSWVELVKGAGSHPQAVQAFEEAGAELLEEVSGEYEDDGDPPMGTETSDLPVLDLGPGGREREALLELLARQQRDGPISSALRRIIARSLVEALDFTPAELLLPALRDYQKRFAADRRALVILLEGWLAAAQETPEATDEALRLARDLYGPETGDTPGPRIGLAYASVLSLVGREGEAIELLERTRQRAPGGSPPEEPYEHGGGNHRVLLRLGDDYKNLGRGDEALARYCEAVGGPDAGQGLEAWQRILTLEQGAGRLEAAAAAYLEALVLAGPRELGFSHAQTLAEAYISMGLGPELEEAATELASAETARGGEGHGPGPWRWFAGVVRQTASPPRQPADEVITFQP